MPWYEYVCPSCDIVLEERRAMEMADWPPVECPVCHGLCERRIAPVSVILRRDGASISSEFPGESPPHEA